MAPGGGGFRPPRGGAGVWDQTGRMGGGWVRGRLLIGGVRALGVRSSQTLDKALIA